MANPEYNQIIYLSLYVQLPPRGLDGEVKLFVHACQTPIMLFCVGRCVHHALGLS